jgi:hypothetical protein
MSARKRAFDINVLYAEMLRRKGLSIADAQALPSEPEPWNRTLTWNATEEERYREWFKTYLHRTLSVPTSRLSLEWFWFAFASGLHRRDTCTEATHSHVEQRDADLPRRQWLSLTQALESIPESALTLAASRGGVTSETQP